MRRTAHPTTNQSVGLAKQGVKGPGQGLALIGKLFGMILGDVKALFWIRAQIKQAVGQVIIRMTLVTGLNQPIGRPQARVSSCSINT